MTFNTNQTEFLSPKQKAAWDTGRQLVPPEVSLADITDPETRAGCTQIYNWTKEYLTSMYNEPDKYNGSPYRMFRLLDDVAEDSRMIDGGIPFSIKQYDNQISKNPCLPDLPLTGLEIVDRADLKILTNKKYPLFCRYFKLFYDAAFRKKVNRIDYLMYNDFRVLAPKYKRSFDDLTRALPDNLKSYASEMHGYALQKGTKLEPHKYYGRFIYKYKSQNVLMLQKNSWRQTPLDIAVPWGINGANTADSYNSFMSTVDSQPDREGLTAYIQKEICACDACGGRKKAAVRCTKEWIEINSKRRLLALCHRDICKWKAAKNNLQYTGYDIKMLKRLLDVRIMQIDNLC